jgi:polyhydroxyalkanoate synthesis regulator phasin
MADSSRLHEILDKLVMFGLGAASATAEGVSKFVDEMVRRGEMSRPEAERLARRVAESAQEAQEALRQRMREEFDRLVREAGLVRADEVAALRARVEALERERDAGRPGPEPA